MQPSKQELRRTMLSTLKAAAAQDPAGRRSAALRRLLAPLLRPEKPLTVAVYAALPHEVDLLPLLDEYPQHRFCFPRCGARHRMVFHRVTDPAAQLAPAALGIPAPAEDLPVVAPQDFDLVLVPGLAFTEEGARLGYGGGYYDRFLPLCTHACIAAAAFAEQMLPHVPTDEHDVRIPRIIHL